MKKIDSRSWAYVAIGTVIIILLIVLGVWALNGLVF